MDFGKELIALLKNGACDYDKCRRLIDELGGCTRIIEGDFSTKTTPIHEAVEYGHYDFALELIRSGGAELDIATEDVPPLIWELQYLDSESEEERFEESRRKLQLIRSLILAGADPNPVCDGEELLCYVRFKVSEGIEDHPERLHRWGMGHLIEAHAYGETERFFEKLKTHGVRRVRVSDWAFWLIDVDQCDCDHAIFEFEDGEGMMLSSYQVGDDDWAFYAVPVSERFAEVSGKYYDILPEDGLIRYRDFYTEESIGTSYWLDLYIDDAILRIHPADITLTMRVGGFEVNDYQPTKRRRLFGQ